GRARRWCGIGGGRRCRARWRRARWRGSRWRAGRAARRWWRGSSRARQRVERPGDLRHALGQVVRERDRLLDVVVAHVGDLLRVADPLLTPLRHLVGELLGACLVLARADLVAELGHLDDLVSPALLLAA